MSVREIPKNRKGVQDEWGAIIALQNEIAAKGEMTKKLQNKQKQKQYLAELQGEIEGKQKLIQMQKDQKHKDAALR